MRPFLFACLLTSYYPLNNGFLFSDENSGGTKDWVYKTLGTTYTFALELRDQGRYGFLLPTNQIMPTGMETFAAIKAMAAAIKI